MLSVVTAFFLPPGVLTSLLGINLVDIPGAENHWAFLVFVIVLLGVVAAQI